MRRFASSSLMPTSNWYLPSNPSAQIFAAALNSIFRESSRQFLCRPNQRNVRSSKSHAVARLSQAEFDGRGVLRFCRHSAACLFTDSLDKSDQVRRSTSCLEAEEQ